MRLKYFKAGRLEQKVVEGEVDIKKLEKVSNISFPIFFRYLLVNRWTVKRSPTETAVVVISMPCNWFGEGGGGEGGKRGLAKFYSSDRLFCAFIYTYSV